MSNYFEWLASDSNTLYFFITWILLGTIVFVIAEIAIFVVEEIEEELKKIKEKKNEKKCK